jgi:hypothetical protein
MQLRSFRFSQSTMNCPIAQVEYCFQISNSCRSHLGLYLDLDFEDFISLEASILLVRMELHFICSFPPLNEIFLTPIKLSKQYLDPNTQLHILSLVGTTHLPTYDLKRYVMSTFSHNTLF